MIDTISIIRFSRCAGIRAMTKHGYQVIRDIIRRKIQEIAIIIQIISIGVANAKNMIDVLKIMECNVTYSSKIGTNSIV